LKGTVQTDRGSPSINVSPKKHSLRILDNLIKNFRLLGYKIMEEGSKLLPTMMYAKMSIYIRKSNAVIPTRDYG
jgi:hypothetical protein